MPVLHLIEVTLRNAFHRELSTHFASTKKHGSNTSNNWYDQVKLSPKSKKALEKVFTKTTRPDDVISRLTFGFWPNLLDCADIPWATVLPCVFPNSNRNLAHVRNADQITTRLHMINDIRNRVAHWEPLWKFGPLMPERKRRKGDAPLVPVSPATTTPDESIVRMTTLHDRMASLLVMLDSDVGRTYKDSYAYEHFAWVCSTEGLTAYRSGKRNKAMPLSRVKRNLRQLIRKKQLITITSTSGSIARVIPL